MKLFLIISSFVFFASVALPSFYASVSFSLPLEIAFAVRILNDLIDLSLKIDIDVSGTV